MMDKMNNLATTAKFFVMILGELTLLFIGISFLVALIQQFVPDEKMREVLGKPKRGLGNILGAAFGALTPFCSCSTIPILVGLLSSGAPFGASMSFLLASPILNPIIIGLFLVLFGWKVTVVYGVVTFALAAVGGAPLLSRPTRMGIVEQEQKGVRAPKAAPRILPNPRLGLPSTSRIFSSGTNCWINATRKEMPIKSRVNSPRIMTKNLAVVARLFILSIISLHVFTVYR
jgi:preprotein translocase subunit SecG